MDERDMEKDGKDRKRKGWRIGKNCYCLELYFHVCNQESERPEGKYLLKILNNPNGEEKYKHLINLK
jgi:hypothetical protein